MTNLTWIATPLGGADNYDNTNNWSPGLALTEAPNVPGDTAFFGVSTNTNIDIETPNGFVDAWVFVAGASPYNFTISNGATFSFVGAGITVNGGAVSVDNANISTMQFFNNSTAGNISITNESGCTVLFADVSTAGGANIENQGLVSFSSSSSAGNAVIMNFSVMGFSNFSSAWHAAIVNDNNLDFADTSTAGSATIHTLAGASTSFFNDANGGNAQFITDAGGLVDFSLSSGPAGNNRLTVGSIAGAGTYDLGDNQLTVGSNGLSTTVGGLIAGAGGSLVKVGHGTLKLSHAGNSYSGITGLVAGTLDLAAVGAAGAGAIVFSAGPQKLKIENGALSHHVFGNLIDFFGKHDVIDLTGLAFHVGATATYHAANHHLTVHSGGVTDTLTLLGSLTTHFEAISDGHGGTDLLLHA